MNHEITFAILCGGKSSRMGTDKGLVMLNGKRLIDYQIEKARQLTENIIILSNQTPYQEMGYPCYEDILKDCGPMGGIYTALQWATTQKVFLLACDLPFLDINLLENMLQSIGDEDVLIPRHKEQLEPLCAIYDKTALPKFKQLLAEEKLSLIKAIPVLNSKIFNTDLMEGISEKCFVNINSKEDLERHLKT